MKRQASSIKSTSQVGFAIFLAKVVVCSVALSIFFFFFNDTATTEIYTLSLHDALPISSGCGVGICCTMRRVPTPAWMRSEEHTSELQSPVHLVCRLLLEKKKKNKI